MEVETGIEPVINCFADSRLCRLGYSTSTSIFCCTTTSIWCERADSSRHNRGFKPQMSSSCITLALFKEQEIGNIVPQ